MRKSAIMPRPIEGEERKVKLTLSFEPARIAEYKAYAKRLRPPRSLSKLIEEMLDEKIAQSNALSVADEATKRAAKTPGPRRVKDR
jgi:hypothetical protein